MTLGWRFLIYDGFHKFTNDIETFFNFFFCHEILVLKLLQNCGKISQIQYIVKLLA